MKSKSLWFAAASLVLAVAMISCGKIDEGTTDNSAPAATATAGKPVDPATAGTVSGTIKLDGAPPKMKTINMAAEPNCAKVHADSPAMTEDVVAGDGGTLQNVFVYLAGDFSAYSLPAPTTPAMIDQKGCQYHPHVLGMMTGQALSVDQFRYDHAQHSPRSQEQPRMERVAATRCLAHHAEFRARRGFHPRQVQRAPLDEGLFRRARHALFPGDRQGRLLHHRQRATRNIYGDGMA